MEVFRTLEATKIMIFHLFLNQNRENRAGGDPCSGGFLEGSDWKVWKPLKILIFNLFFLANPSKSSKGGPLLRRRPGGLRLEGLETIENLNISLIF